MMVKVICDSTGDLTKEIIDKYGISIAPLNVLFGTESLRDGPDITPEQFYKRLVVDKLHPTTSAPSPGTFSELYTKLSKETDEIVVVTISSGISATYESALQAKALVGNICKIEVVDSLLTCGGLGLPAYRAAQAAAQGAKLGEIVDMLKDILPRTRAYMIFDTLEYLRKGGRIGAAKALLGGMLKLNPIITLKEGLIHPVMQARNRTKAINELVKLVIDTPKLEDVVIQDATTPDELEILADAIGVKFPKEKLIRTKVGPAIGVHTGPNVLAACFIAGK
ncbi:MAG: DegV family protein [Dehalococcoidia bacterium]|nr:DegV family protein [Dehalococcoidia bacterium]